MTKRTVHDLEDMHSQWQKKKRRQQMAAKKQGTCELCGQKKNIIRNHGKMVCTTCMNMQAHIKKRPELVIEEMVRLHGTTYFPVEITDENPAALRILAEIRAAAGVDEKQMASDLPGIIAELPRQIADLQAANNDLARKLAEVEKDGREESSCCAEICGLIDLPEDADTERIRDRVERMLVDKETAFSMLDTINEEFVRCLSAGLNSVDADAKMIVDELLDRRQQAKEMQTQHDKLFADNLDLLAKKDRPDDDRIEIGRLLHDHDLLAAVNVLADTMREQV